MHGVYLYEGMLLYKQCMGPNVTLLLSICSFHFVYRTLLPNSSENEHKKGCSYAWCVPIRGNFHCIQCIGHKASTVHFLFQHCHRTIWPPSNEKVSKKGGVLI